jgi:aminoglycoside phosphotransferase (APT) family kinase protein
MTQPLPEPVAGALRDLFGVEPVHATALTGGFSHRAWRCEFGGERVVIKASNSEPYRAELWHEAEALIGLNRVRRNTRHARHIAYAQNGDWHVLVQQFVDGVPGVSLFAENKAQNLRKAYVELARVLAALHKTEVGPLRALQNDVARANSFSMRNRAAHARTHLTALKLPAPLNAALDAALRHRAWRSTPTVFLHGDAGLHNMLWRARGRGTLAALLDWEWSGWGPALCDLAWLQWTMRWRKVEQLWPAVIEAYDRQCGAATQLSPAAMRAIQLGQIAMILLRSANNPPAFAEWLRRADWTVAAKPGA